MRALWSVHNVDRGVRRCDIVFGVGLAVCLLAVVVVESGRTFRPTIVSTSLVPAPGECMSVNYEVVMDVPCSVITVVNQPITREGPQITALPSKTHSCQVIGDVTHIDVDRVSVVLSISGTVLSSVIVRFRSASSLSMFESAVNGSSENLLHRNLLYSVHLVPTIKVDGRLEFDFAVRRDSLNLVERTVVTLSFRGCRVALRETPVVVPLRHAMLRMGSSIGAAIFTFNLLRNIPWSLLSNLIIKRGFQR